MEILTTMITPYKTNGTIDFETAENITVSRKGAAKSIPLINEVL